MRRRMLCAIPLLLVGCAGTPPEDFDWAAQENRFVDQGLLRLERAPVDVAFTAEDLSQAFRRSVFSSGEKTAASGALRRWPGPIFYRTFAFCSQRSENRLVAETMRRLTKQTRRRILAQNPGQAYEVEIRFLAPEDFAPLLDRARDVPKFARFVREFRDTPQLACTQRIVFGPEGASPTQSDILAAFVFIRAGLPDRLNRSCVEKGLAVAMGALSDHPDNRPSIFNDVPEFALLTTHDELLLRILYDPRLEAGMTEAEAMPIVRQIARELVAGEAGG